MGPRNLVLLIWLVLSFSWSNAEERINYVPARNLGIGQYIRKTVEILLTIGSEPKYVYKGKQLKSEQKGKHTKNKIKSHRYVYECLLCHNSILMKK